MNIKGFELVEVPKESVIEYREGFTDILENVSLQFTGVLLQFASPDSMQLLPRYGTKFDDVKGIEEFIFKEVVNKYGYIDDHGEVDEEWDGTYMSLLFERNGKDLNGIFVLDGRFYKES